SQAETSLAPASFRDTLEWSETDYEEVLLNHGDSATGVKAFLRAIAQKAAVLIVLFGLAGSSGEHPGTPSAGLRLGRGTPDMTTELAGLVENIRHEERVLMQGGGNRAIARQHEKGRLTARERIDGLLDEGARFFELGVWAAWNMYQEWG